EQVMKKDVECVTGGDTVQNAAQKMRSANVGFLPICDASNKVIGTITDRDLSIRVIADGKPATTKISDVMTREVVSCRPADDLTRAQELMSSRKKSRMLVTDEGGRLLGVISLSDIAQHDGGRAAETLKQVAGRESRAA